MVGGDFFLAGCYYYGHSKSQGERELGWFQKNRYSELASQRREHHPSPPFPHIDHGYPVFTVAAHRSVPDHPPVLADTQQVQYVFHPPWHDRLQEDGADTDGFRASEDDGVEPSKVQRHGGLGSAVLIGASSKAPWRGVLHVLVRLWR